MHTRVFPGYIAETFLVFLVAESEIDLIDALGTELFHDLRQQIGSRRIVGIAWIVSQEITEERSLVNGSNPESARFTSEVQRVHPKVAPRCLCFKNIKQRCVFNAESNPASFPLPGLRRYFLDNRECAVQVR